MAAGKCKLRQRNNRVDRHTCKRLSEERNVICLVVGDFLQVMVEGFAVASFLEVMNGEVRKAFAVELVLWEALVGVSYRTS